MERKWVTSWSAAAVKGGFHLPPLHLNNGLVRGTARTVLRCGIDGNAIRLLFSNRYGTKPLTLSAVSVAHVTDGKLKTDAPVPVTFTGQKSVTIAVGDEVLSDEIPFESIGGEKIAVSIYAKKAVFQTKGLYGGDTWLSAGNQTDTKDFRPLWHLSLTTPIVTMQTNPFLTRVDVLASEDSYALVVAGDSTLSNEVPYILAERLRQKGIRNISVIQQAIAGNRILDNGKGIIGNLYGENLPDRFDKDIAKCCGVKKILLKEGINDIIHPRSRTMKKALFSTAEEIIDGLELITEKAHSMGAEIYISCFTPFKEAGKLIGNIDDFKWSEEMQSEADKVNNFIRNSGSHDGCVTVDNFTDENKPFTMKQELTIDHLHYHLKGQELFVDNVMDAMFK